MLPTVHLHSFSCLAVSCCFVCETRSSCHATDIMGIQSQHLPCDCQSHADLTYGGFKHLHRKRYLGISAQSCVSHPLEFKNTQSYPQSSASQSLVPGPSTPSRSLLEMKVLRCHPNPDLQNQKHRGCVLTAPPGNSDAQ